MSTWLLKKGTFTWLKNIAGTRPSALPPSSLFRRACIINCSQLIINELGHCPTRSDNLIKINKHCLQFLLLCFVLHMPNIISLNLNYMLIDQCKLLTLFRSMLSINAEWSTCKKNNKGMYVCFYGSKKFLDCLM